MVPSQISSNSWQSYFDLSSKGLEFSPFYPNVLLLFQTTNSMLTCAQLCLSITSCRTFSFDFQNKSCRLYEGDIDRTGLLITSLSSESICGSMRLSPNDFLAIGQSCFSCVNSRYLTCVNSTCQCPLHTYFDGSICRSQKRNGSGCSYDIECRTDLNLTCLWNMYCGCK